MIEIMIFAAGVAIGYALRSALQARHTAQAKSAKAATVGGGGGPVEPE